MRGTRVSALVAAMLAAVWLPVAAGAPPAAAAPAAPPAAPAPAPAAAPPAAPAAQGVTEPKHVLSQWQSLYLEGRKIGYVARILSGFPDGGRRLETNLFLLKSPGADKFGYYKMITADVDAHFRPRALECRVVSDALSWQVQGRVDGGELVLVRTVGEKSATARIPLGEDETFLSWTLLATAMTGSPGQTRRWSAVDESLGALLPEPCLVHVIGPHSIAAGGAGPALSGLALVWACGTEQAVHLVAADGRILRSIWQSAPMVAVAATFAEARSLALTPEEARGPDIPGFEAGGYRDARRGFGLRVPPYPYVAHASPETGAVTVSDLTGEAYVLARPLAMVGPGGTGAEAGAAALADLAQRQWAARLEDVQASPAADAKVGGRDARMVGGTARLGCTTLYFHNYILPGAGWTYFVSLAAADRPVSAEPVLAREVVGSVRLGPPEGPLPLQAAGDTIRSPFYGFELRRPSSQWSIPSHVDGPAAALELGRRDQAALVVVRMMTPKPGQSAAQFAAEQAQLAAENLDVPRPEPRAVRLGGRPAYEIDYEAKKVLSGRPARCALVYTEVGGRILCLALIAAADADASAVKELQEVRESLKFASSEPSK